METRAYYMKIGLFVVLGLCAAVALAVGVGATTTHRKTIKYYTYFNEPVTGLDVGAPVKARGVDVGRVGDISFAPDRTMIEVRMDLLVGVLDHFGGTLPNRPVNPNLRAQLASQGVTGSRFISMDFFDPTTDPPPALSFAPPGHYVPAAKSQMKSLGDSVTKAMDGLANLVDTMSREGLSEKTVQAMSTVNDVLIDVDRVVGGLQEQQIPRRAAATLDKLDAAVGKLGGVLDRVDGETGLVATAKRSIGSVGDTGRVASGAIRDLGQTLNEVREAAAAIRLLAEELEREPDSVLKGRAQGSP
jgi:ABC-type transporter Mla subunit MlaD